jgi:membrane protein implicated in regulation of membrane protease activity
MAIWIWLVVAVAAAIGELLTTDLFLASVSAAAVVGAGMAVFLVPGAIQVVVFAVLALLGIVVFRPLIKHALGIDSAAPVFGSVVHSTLAGKRAIVTQQVDAGGGQIRIGQGEFWTARPYDPGQTIAPGEPVEIVVVDGLTALVEPVAPAPSLSDESEIATQKGR